MTDGLVTDRLDAAPRRALRPSALVQALRPGARPDPVTGRPRVWPARFAVSTQIASLLLPADLTHPPPPAPPAPGIRYAAPVPAYPATGRLPAARHAAPPPVTRRESRSGGRPAGPVRRPARSRPCKSSGRSRTCVGQRADRVAGRRPVGVRRAHPCTLPRGTPHPRTPDKSAFNGPREVALTACSQATFTKAR